MKYLALFTISPVQSFIAQSRKTVDMYNGSKILSDIMLNTLKVVKEKKGIEILFPFFDISDNNNSLPNKFILRIERNSDNEVRELCKEIDTSIRLGFIKIADDVIVIKGLKPTEIFKQQIEKFLEVFWVAIPEIGEYHVDFDNLNKYIAGIKNVRTFEQMSELGRKCSLCGERNVLFCEKGNKTKMLLKPHYFYLNYEDRINVDQYNDNLQEIDDLTFGKSEGLCAVCFTKRFYKKKSFPSTAGIATMNTFKLLGQDINSRKQIKKYKEIFREVGYDEQLLYEENITKEYFRKNLNFESFDEKEIIAFLSDENLDKIKKTLKDLKKELKNDFPKYYALLMFDGDDVGKWIGGERIKDLDKLGDFQSELSARLKEFARASAALLKGPRGKTVYAGGDDFLGFVNLYHLFDVMAELRSKFIEIVNNPLIKSGYFDENNSISFSGGIAIAHYKTPLCEVLKWARLMESESKEMGGKNALGIAVVRHSGEISKTVYKFSEIENIIKLRYFLLNGIFSNSFINILNTEFSRLLNDKNDLIDIRLINSEIKRLIKRSYNKSDEQKNSSHEYDELIKIFHNILKSLYINENGFPYFIELLNIIDFYVRKVKNV